MVDNEHEVGGGAAQMQKSNSVERPILLSSFGACSIRFAPSYLSVLILHTHVK